MADYSGMVIPWWIQDWINTYQPDIPATETPPPSTVGMWTGEAPQGGAGGSTPYPTPPYAGATPSPDIQAPSTEAGGGTPLPPGSITDVPGGEQPLNDLPTPPGVEPPVMAAQPAGEPGVDAGPGLYGPPSTSDWQQPTNWPGFMGGVRDLFGGIGSFFGNVFSGNPFPNIAPGGSPVGSFTPDAVASGQPLPGAFAGLGASGGNLGGTGNVLADQILKNWMRFGMKPQDAFGRTIGSYPDRFSPAGMALAANTQAYRPRTPGGFAPSNTGQTQGITHSGQHIGPT